jgi:hypothetical protein
MPTAESLAIAPATSQAQVNELEREAQRLGLQLQRLAAALADRRSAVSARGPA